ncbi:Retrovirus-related Pol polyprotein from transposon RE2 [Vitis vinifera]|uniref:Retrovirus-related Pol polyprotein from transposon RE2 n=1 Tax=Vitis vinifera TaxID=29760 RepID=A0A438GCR9_VITVI|nr:Retrovirus-related Pol polyprotein from transposon RE2 [Vitis vinifera]
MYITMDVVFHEDSMYFSSESELQGEYHKEIQTLDYDYHISEDDESRQSELVNQETGELDMSGQQFRSKDVFTEIPNQSSSVEGVLNLEPDPFMKRLPHRHNKALVDPRWKAAMNEEMKSLQKNETWELVECPPGKKPVGCRWIYTVKYKVDGSIERFKARLVAKGCKLDWLLQQFDVKNAFLHDELSEEVYMDLPPGCMVSEKQCQKVCKIEEVIVWVEAIPESMVWKEIGMSGCQPVNTPIEEVDDRRSTSDYFTFVGGNLVTWKSKKQNIVTRSSAEAEFRGMTLGLCEALWLRLLL